MTARADSPATNVEVEGLAADDTAEKDEAVVAGPPFPSAAIASASAAESRGTRQ
jgi:hypothetical protein